MKSIKIKIMEIVLRDKQDNMNYELCIGRIDGKVSFVVVDEKADLRLEFEANIKEYGQMKSFIEDGLWEYEKSLEKKQ
jgi:hypothetical protein